MSFAQIKHAISLLKIEELKDSFVFDVYSGVNVDLGQKSIALGLIFQDFSRTLEEQVISAYVGKVIESLKKETGAELR